ncbi:hypothetical protein [Vibrio navarrensis]|uniref:Uncharacterized protein n=1 Tax=Vibrio navarrensis TaxID=29495 RepID=A0AAJ4IGT4_9VIBR|nr:hypothetical protein I3X05_23745 [Vibrio navarrensis]
MSIDFILKTLGLRQESLVERVNRKIVSGYQPSDMAKVVVGKVSSKRFNQMMQEASSKYYKNHEDKVFKDE